MFNCDLPNSVNFIASFLEMALLSLYLFRFYRCDLKGIKITLFERLIIYLAIGQILLLPLYSIFPILLFRLIYFHLVSVQVSIFVLNLAVSLYDDERSNSLTRKAAKYAFIILGCNFLLFLYFFCSYSVFQADHFCNYTAIFIWLLFNCLIGLMTNLLFYLKTENSDMDDNKSVDFLLKFLEKEEKESDKNQIYNQLLFVLCVTLLIDLLARSSGEDYCYIYNPNKGNWIGYFVCFGLSVFKDFGYVWCVYRWLC